MPEEDGDAGSFSSRELEQRVGEFWSRAGVAARALAAPPNAPVFRFTEGPPTANGPPHIGHVVGRVLKDVQLRYRRQRGYRVESSKAGWDCHGLGVEIEIEKRHRLRSVTDIEAYGVERFCEECRSDALRVAAIWERMSERLGFWLDYAHPYRTMDAPYIESVWWSLRELFGRGMLEKGHQVLPYCPRCETTLSSHEVAQGYHDATDPSVAVRFPLDGPGPARALLVWTTTPWTLPANLLAAVRADLDYVAVRLADESEVVLADAARARFAPDGATVVEKFPGSALVGRRYRPPFDAIEPAPDRFRVVADDFVTTEEGTGIVHVAPSFGPDDYRVGAREGVGVFDPLDARGRFTDLVPLVRGQSFKAADGPLVADLERRGLLYRSGTIRHTYPFCWRCDTPLLYRAIDAWFVRTSRVTDRLVACNREVTWVPAYLRDGRFGNFLTEAKDWALSRGRYWGTPLPIWVCPDGHPTCLGSFAELAQRAGASLGDGFDPHRVTVDRIEIACATCGKRARREPYTIDAWYDSGAAPFAQYHYPFEPGPFDPDAPLDFISEALDQTRGWFYTLLVLAVSLFDRPAYRACLTSGLVLDDAGRKMSKSKGNALEPSRFLDEVGADAARWGFLSIDFTEGMRVGVSEVSRSANRTIGTLGNAVRFHLANAREDGLAPPPGRPTPTGALDRWLLSRLEATRQSVERSLETFDPRAAAAAVRQFVDDLSTWYLRRSRPRFWGEEGAAARSDAHATLAYALLGLARTIAPLLPFVAEWVYQEVGGFEFASAERSVHLAGWPGPLAPRDEALERGMDRVRSLAEMGRALRQEAGVKSRIPLAEIRLYGEAARTDDALGAEADRLLAAELNVRRVVRGEAAAAPALASDAWAVRLDGDTPIAALPRSPTPELLEEGWVRELGRRLQQRRKELRLRYGESVRIVVSAPERLRRAVESHLEELRREVVAERVELTDEPLPAGPGVRDFEFDGMRCSVEVIPVSAAAETPR